MNNKDKKDFKEVKFKWTSTKIALIELFKPIFDMKLIIPVGIKTNQDDLIRLFAKKLGIENIGNPSSEYCKGKDKKPCHRIISKIFKFEKDHIEKLNDKDDIHYREKSRRAKCNKTEFDIDDKRKANKSKKAGKTKPKKAL